MKKYTKLLAILLVTLLVAGCGKEDSKKEAEGKRECTLVSTNTADNYKMEGNYIIYTKGDVVTKVETTETVTSEDKEILDQFEEYTKSTYETANEAYGGYDIDITNKDGKLVSKVVIDYDKMDLDKYVANNSVMKQYVNDDGDLLVEGVVSSYESMGAECKEAK